jgi:membrane-associated PAP2 superfamily phosphatase
MDKLFTSAKFAFGFPAALYLFNLVLVVLTFIYGFHFELWNVFSPPLHFGGGAAMAIIYFYFWEKNPNLYVFKNKIFVNLTLVLGFVALIGVLWELHEFLLDILFPALAAQANLQDTIADLFFDLLGGGFTALLYFKPRH